VDGLSNLRAPHEGDDPPGVSLMPQGGSSRSQIFESDFWLWPLPPPGPVTFVVAWPAFGIDETDQQLDGSLLRDASAKAITLWET
jgi:hypothetical protein